MKAKTFGFHNTATPRDAVTAKEDICERCSIVGRGPNSPLAS